MPDQQRQQVYMQLEQEFGHCPIGDEMPDGAIYAGISPDTGKAIYARPKDESGPYNFYEAETQAKSYGFRLPTKDELAVLYQNRNKGKLKGTFNETGSNPTGLYWTSLANKTSAWAQCFSDGQKIFNRLKTKEASLRLIR
jgi:hypothetical protein